MSARFIWLACGISGFLSVALGAFGAHGLKKFLATVPDGPQRLEWWHTASQYQMAHALALGFLGALAIRGELGSIRVATLAWILGTVLFSGSLYLMTLTGLRWLGMVTPLGGVGFLVGWAAFLVAVWRQG